LDAAQQRTYPTLWLDTQRQAAMQQQQQAASSDSSKTPPSASTVRSSSEERPSFGAGRLILVAEDNPDLLALLLHFLKRMGFRTLSANNTEQALAHLQHTLTHPAPETTPALLLSDMIMPQGGGLFLLSWVEQHLPSLPVAFMSGYMDEYTARSAAEIPCLSKPFSSKELEIFLRRIFAGLPPSIEAPQPPQPPPSNEKT